MFSQEKFENKEMLKKCIEDICHDNTFPLDVNTFEELCDRYLKVFWGITPEDEFDFLELGTNWQVESYKFLFKKWSHDNKY